MLPFFFTSFEIRPYLKKEQEGEKEEEKNMPLSMRAEERSRAGLEANLHRVERVADEHAHGRLETVPQQSGGPEVAGGS